MDAKNTNVDTDGSDSQSEFHDNDSEVDYVDDEELKNIDYCNLSEDEIKKAAVSIKKLSASKCNKFMASTTLSQRVTNESVKVSFDTKKFDFRVKVFCPVCKTAITLSKQSKFSFRPFSFTRHVRTFHMK